MRAHVALGTVAWTDAIDISPDTLYLLIEFQSSIDRFMAVRIANYLTLLYQDLIEQKQLTATDRLPPVLSIVLYNGEARWDGACELTDLIEPVPGGLGAYRPQLRYLLLDQGAEKQLAAANEAQLEAWAVAVLDAGTLAEVLVRPPATH